MPKKEDIFNIPNMLSLSRVVFLPLLYYLVYVDEVKIFLVAYFILAITDAFDGFIARHFNMSTEIGKKIDSASDLLFILSSAYFIYALYPEIIYANWTLFWVVMASVALSFIISAIKFKKPIMLHTLMMKGCNFLGVSAVLVPYFIEQTQGIYYLSFVLWFYLISFIILVCLMS